MASSSHEDYAREHEIKGSSDRGFGQVFAGFFAILGFWPLLGGEAPRWWLVGIAAAFLIVAYVRPSLLAAPNRWWMKFGLLLAKVVNPLVMGLVFYLTVTPTGWIMRALGKDPLRLQIDRQAKSYWIERKPPGPAPETMSQQF
jgi:hypothetical protein